MAGRPKGYKKTGGRQRGVRNKVGADVRALAVSYAPSVIAELGRLAIQAESEQARVSAAKEILDRAYGKAPQPLDHSDFNIHVSLTMIDGLKQVASHRSNRLTEVLQSNATNGHAYP